MGKAVKEFLPLNLAVLTVSDTRTEETDTSGKLLCEQAKQSGHNIVAKKIITDDLYRMRAVVADWIADEQINVILTTGGTGVTGRDVANEAIGPLLDKEIPGFGELFRQISYEEIKTSTIQSRAFAGLSNGTYIFAMPGSTGACETAWVNILQYQLDIRHRPCNFAELIVRLKET